MATNFENIRITPDENLPESEANLIRTLAELGASALLLMSISANPDMEPRPVDNIDAGAGVSDTSEKR